jgi:hypothetical protein
MNESLLQLHKWIAYIMIIQAIPIFFILLHIIPGTSSVILKKYLVTSYLQEKFLSVQQSR